MNLKLAAAIAALAAFALPIAAPAQCCGASRKANAGSDKLQCDSSVNDTETKPDAAPAAKPADTAIKVPSIQCGMCIKKITKAIKSVEGVREVTVDPKTKIAKISFDPEKTSPEKIETAIVKAGYIANDKQADPEAYSNLPDCCKAK